MMPVSFRGVWSQCGAFGTRIHHPTAFDATDIIAPISTILVVLTDSMFYVYGRRALI